MDDEILRKLEEQDKKLGEIYHSVEKTRKYLFWTLIITLVMIILPLIGLIFVVPGFLNSFNYGSLGL